MGPVISGPTPTEKTVKAGYLFFGGELFPAEQFLERMKAGLIDAEGQPAVEERFDLAATGWRDILDAARTMSFFNTPWRILVVTAAKSAKEEPAELTAEEAAGLKEFFADPTPRTVLIVLYEGALKTKPLYKLFSKLPAERAAAEEMAPIKSHDLGKWVKEAAERMGLEIGREAVGILLDLAENDQRTLSSELEKLSVYIGDRKIIEAADVWAAIGNERNIPGWELTDALESGDIPKALGLLDRMLSDGDNGNPMLGLLAGFLRDLLLGRIGLAQGRDRVEIYREIRPTKSHPYYLAENTRKFFTPIERLTDADFARLAAELERLDMRLKSTDSEAKALFEAFVCDFGRAVSRPGPTSKPRG